MPTLRLALAQMNAVMGDLAANARTIQRFLAQAGEQGADLVVFPEMSLCGYPPEDLLLKPKFLEDCRDMLEALCPTVSCLTALVGFPHVEGGLTHNAAAVIQHGRVARIYHKRELPNYGVFDEKRYFTPGREPLWIEFRGALVGITICEDIWVERGPVEQDLSRVPHGLVLNLSASPFYAGKLEQRRRLLEGMSERLNCPVAYVNLVGGQDELVFDGGSMVVSPRGSLLTCSERFDENLTLIDLDLPEAAPDSRPERKWTVPLQTGQVPKPALAAPTLSRTLTRAEEVYQALVLGTRDYLQKNGFHEAVIGLSGGIDSALTAAVAVEALGPAQVIGITMPSKYNSPDTLNDARRVAENLGIRFLSIPIGELMQTYVHELAPHFGTGETGLAFENLQARIRGNLLMSFSNRFGWLVLTTGNKSELATGYCTLYGDMAGGFAVIKDVPKTLVYELAREANRRAGKEIIPESTIARAPSAELRPNQKDEDSLPPYDVLDPILAAYVEEDLSPQEIESRGFPADLVGTVVRKVDLSEYKRRQAPPGIKITPKAFGRDRRLPITNRYRHGEGLGD